MREVVRASSEVDGKNVFQFVNRGHKTRVAVNAEAALGGTDLAVTDNLRHTADWAVRVRGGEGAGMITPPLVVKDFPFTSISDAV